MGLYAIATHSLRSALLVSLFAKTTEQPAGLLEHLTDLRERFGRSRKTHLYRLLEVLQSFLRPAHQSRILKGYQDFCDEPGFTAVVDREDILANDGRFSIPLYVKGVIAANQDADVISLKETWTAFDSGGKSFWEEMNSLVEMLDGVAAQEARDA